MLAFLLDRGGEELRQALLNGFSESYPPITTFPRLSRWQARVGWGAARGKTKKKQHRDLVVGNEPEIHIRRINGMAVVSLDWMGTRVFGPKLHKLDTRRSRATAETSVRGHAQEQQSHGCVL